MIRKLFKFILVTIVLGALGIILFIGLVYIGAFGHIANKEELTEIKQAESSVVYSADNQIIGRFFLTNRTNVNYNKLPKHLIQALIATEDARFYEHNGIDKVAMLRVLFKTILLGNASAGGGSTLSQQLSKNLFPRKNFGILSMPVNKTKEAILANRFESIYSKEEILTLYFNTVPFGEDVYGIESAAQRYFSVPVNELTLEQSAILVGMLKANTYYNPRLYPKHAFTRRNTVLFQMKKAGYLSAKEYLSKSTDTIKIEYKNLVKKNPNGYFLKQVRKKANEVLKDYKKENGKPWNIESDGLKIETTLVSELQETALEARKHHLIRLQKTMDKYWNNSLKHRGTIKNIIQKEWQQTTTYKTLKKSGIDDRAISDSSKVKKERFIFNWENEHANISAIDSINHYLKMLSAAVYGVDTQNGAVKIYVAGNNFEYLPYNLITSERQVASTFKPIVYTAAIENGQEPCDWINNEVKVYEEYDNWKPENYDHSNGGYYSMVGALAKSVNVPTVATYFKVGAKKLQETANALGLTKELKRVPSTALGTTSYSLQNLVHAYIPFATRNNTVEPYYISTIKDNKGNIIYQHKNNNTNKTKPVLKTKTLETMQLLLKGVVDKGTAVKLKSQYGAKGAWAGKTGTSQNYSDSWFIGFNSHIIIGSWVGCKYPSINLPSYIGGGSVAALPIVGSVVGKNYEDKDIQKKLSVGFPKFSDEVLSSCDCEFYREENTIEKIFDLFDKKKKKKGNFFSRLFGSKKDKNSTE